MPTRTSTLGLRSALVAYSIVAGFSVPALCSESRETPVVRAVARAKAAVVNIHSEKSSADRESGRKINGMGTGIIVDERGYIVTNQHVVAGVDALRVTLADGSMYQARVISYDQKHDLAIIKINASRPLAEIPLGTSSDLMLGEDVIAVGNPFGYEHTVTRGIVSSLSRDVEVDEKQSYKNLIQTDASINPGNSGGPLLNLNGEVVGINVAIRAGAQRIGFAIPIDDARGLIAKLLNIQKLNETYLGLLTRDVKTPEQMKLVVNSTEPNSPASIAGFRTGDVVVQAGSVVVRDQADLQRALLGHAAGDKVPVVIKRDGADTTLMVELTRFARTNDVAVKTVSRPSPAVDAIDQQIWQTLGMRLVKVSEAEVQRRQPRYRGGLRIEEVRPDSPAARHALQAGDILVDLHSFYTVKKEDVAYILNNTVNNPQGSPDQVMFRVIRGSDLFYGYLQLK